MSMHIVGPHMTTTRHNRKSKKPNKRLAQAQAEHTAWLEKMGVGKVKLPVNKKGERVGINSIPDYKQHQSTAELSNNVGNAAAKESNKYTGTYIKGIATTHKSNLVPITSREQAIDAANMRRN